MKELYSGMILRLKFPKIHEFHLCDEDYTGYPKNFLNSGKLKIYLVSRPSWKNSIKNSPEKDPL